jgi:TM2 domain-containing membrane protein YozV
MSEMTEIPPGAPQRTTVALVAIISSFFGGWGIHKFMLNMTTPGIITAVLSCCGVGSIICLIEGIIYLTKTDQEFYQVYVVEKKEWF